MICNISISGIPFNLATAIVPIYIISKKLKKVDVFRKVFNKYTIEKLRAVFITNKIQLNTTARLFHLQNIYFA